MATSLRSINKQQNVDDSTTTRKHILPNLYCTLPTLEILNMSQLESMCLSRLSLLKSISLAKLELSKEQCNQQIGLLLKAFSDRDEELYQSKDETSHYLLRLAMANSSDLEWFIQQEMLLLRYRLENITIEQFQQFLQKNAGFGWSVLNEEEFQLNARDLFYLYDSKLYKRALGVEKDTADNEDPVLRIAKVSCVYSDFLKMPFQEVSQLIARKKVLLKRGVAYIAKHEFHDVIIESFRSYLIFAMDRIREEYQRIAESYPHLSSFFRSLPKQSGIAVTANHGKITAAEIAPISRQSFPMCMRVMHDGLLKMGKLKYDGRLQFSTFLKAIGLSYEDAIGYWKSSFAKRVSGAEFDKEYAYMVRHTYGLEGKGISYSPSSCAKIISKVPKNSEEIHGCPYVWSQEKLEQRLRDYGVDDITINEIINATQISPNLACGKHFDYLHKDNTFNIKVNHPNQFYDSSREYYKKLKDLEDAKNAAAEKLQQ
ncbi:DNA polymerase alpha primase subunit [Heterostelium album PN500]|uniref:DNA polymerase alpha primase subunit n=1 Tax=Heterostelium pallidum (strain ATCC 26659 / Pp 5 / PN500) TaxID=670386 RepID=D3B9D0_HETP5|nr:DNA polymerase alpha primase subunit [Heterostelium album PN500]EFA81842.1 DNA polymerase alpha primase subunit [Heterostelium album PN500]|eukprot:XP_020433959.1 DNA polymerase alpha primase subunit [Heterostelium album PN500]